MTASRLNYIFLLILCALVQCKNKPLNTDSTVNLPDKNTVTLSDAQFKNADLTVGQLQNKPIASQIKLNGKIDVPPQNLASISVPLGGYLKNTNLIPGMPVRRGEVIAELEDPQYVQLQENYLHAKSKLHFAQLDYDRQLKLNQSRAASDKVLQLAQAELASQQIQLKALAQQLQLIHVRPELLSTNNISRCIRIYSPIEGYVSKVNIHIGTYVNPSEILFELINPNTLQLNLTVYEKDIAQIKVGQPVIAYSNQQTDKQIAAKVTLVSQNMAADGTATVHCQFLQKDSTLKPGMYMNAVVAVQTSTSDALPEESIVDFDGQSFVFEETGKQTYHMTPVTLGTRENGYVQIVNGQELQKHKIVIKNAYTLLMKLKNQEEE